MWAGGRDLGVRSKCMFNGHGAVVCSLETAGRRQSIIAACGGDGNMHAGVHIVAVIDTPAIVSGVILKSGTLSRNICALLRNMRTLARRLLKTIG